MAFRFGIGAVSVLVAACGHALVPPPIAATPAPSLATPLTGLFFPGETMTFEVDYGGIPAGDIAFAVGNIGHDAGRTEVVISSRINSSGVAALIKHIEDCTTTTVDVASGRPVVVESAAQYGDVSGSAHASYEGSIVDVQSKRASDAKPQRMHFDLHGDIAYDAHTAMATTPAATKAKRTWVSGQTSAPAPSSKNPAIDAQVKG